MKIQKKIAQIGATHSRPPKSTIFPDHPHPTMLIEGGQEPGDGNGWKSWESKKNNKEEDGERRYKTKQGEFYQVGNECLRLSFENLMLFEDCLFGRSFVTCLPDRILLGPYDEGSRSVYPLRGWDRPLGVPSLLSIAPMRDLSRSNFTSIKVQKFTLKEVPL